MNFLDQISTLKRLDALIRRKGTGTPRQLASRLEISRTSVFNYLNILKNLGAPIAYCNHRQSYFYQEPFTLVL